MTIIALLLQYCKEIKEDLTSELTSLINFCDTNILYLHGREKCDLLAGAGPHAHDGPHHGEGLEGEEAEDEGGEVSAAEELEPGGLQPHRQGVVVEHRQRRGHLHPGHPGSAGNKTIILFTCSILLPYIANVRSWQFVSVYEK